MRYFGGKQRVAKELSMFMQPYVDKATSYYEPFVGGASVVASIRHPRRIVSDANAALITLYKALQAGWEPPDSVTEEEYSRYKVCQDSNDPMTAFLGFGCSFAGKWFGGFAQSKDRNYASNALRSLSKKMKTLQDVTFLHRGYDEFEPEPGSFVYCDPPYAGTTQYGAVGNFDSDKFWKWVARTTDRGVYIVVSEYAAPKGFLCIWEKETKTDIRDKTGGKSLRVERLFKYCS